MPVVKKKGYYVVRVMTSMPNRNYLIGIRTFTLFSKTPPTPEDVLVLLEQQDHGTTTAALESARENKRWIEQIKQELKSDITKPFKRIQWTDKITNERLNIVISDMCLRVK